MKEQKTLKHDLFNTPVRKKGINSKAKGSANEREAARSLIICPTIGVFSWHFTIFV